MTEPDEVHIAWGACAAARYDDEENGNPLGLPQGMPNFEDFRDGYRAGAAASAERIKELEAEARELNEALVAVVMEVTARDVPITTDTIRFSAPIRALLKEPRND